MDIERITKVKILFTKTDDKRIWWLDKRGDFSVKSAYCFAYEKQVAPAMSSTSSNSVLPQIWKFMWNWPMPPHLRICIWRAIRNKLPTRDLLQRRKFLNESVCVLCSQVDEDLHHLLFKCNSSLMLWKAHFPHLEFFPKGPDNISAWTDAWEGFSKLEFLFFFFA